MKLLYPEPSLQDLEHGCGIFLECLPVFAFHQVPDLGIFRKNRCHGQNNALFLMNIVKKKPVKLFHLPGAFLLYDCLLGIEPEVNKRCCPDETKSQKGN